MRRIDGTLSVSVCVAGAGRSGMGGLPDTPFVRFDTDDSDGSLIPSLVKKNARGFWRQSMSSAVCHPERVDCLYESKP